MQRINTIKSSNSHVQNRIGISNGGFFKALEAPVWTKISVVVHALMFLVTVTAFFVFDFHPFDDLLRHVVSYAWDYSHVAMYPLSSLPQYNLYPAFDFLAGLITQVSSPPEAATIISLMCVSFMMLCVYTTCRYWGNRHQASLSDVLLVSTIFLTSMTVLRAGLGRPESWALAWALCATTLTNGRPIRTAFICAGGILASLSYWLAPVLFPLILVSQSGWKKRFSVFLGLCLFHLAFWYIWSAGDIVHWLTMMSSWDENRTVIVRELTPISFSLIDDFSKIMVYTFTVCLAVVGYQFWTECKTLDKAESRKLGLHYLMTIGVFVGYLATNVSRILPTAFAALLQIALKGMAKSKIPAAISLFVSVTIFLNWGSQMLDQQVFYTRGPSFILPHGSRVLAPFGAASFSMINANPGGIEILPAMEIGASTKEVALLAAKMVDVDVGPITCDDLHAAGVNFVVDNSIFPGALLPCMNLTALTDTGWALLAIQDR